MPCFQAHTHSQSAVKKSKSIRKSKFNEYEVGDLCDL
jgi:hypothetical protein